MNQRINPFANLTEPPAFTTKPRREKPVEQEAVDQIAAENNFPSRQAAKVVKEPKRKKRIYTTGRNQQFNVKASGTTLDRFYKLADERRVSLCELLELALEALEREGAATPRS
jgi:hypothetical protein